MIEHGIEGTMPRSAADIKRVDRLFEALGQKDKLMKEVRNHLRLDPKPHKNRVRVPHILDRFLHNRTQQRKPTLRFMTTDRNVPPWPCGDVLDQENPFTIYRKRNVDIFGNIFKTGDKTKNFCAAPMFCDEGCQCKVPSEMCTNPQNNSANKVYRNKPNSKPIQQKINGFVVNEKLTRLQVPVFNNPPSKVEWEPDYFDCLKGRQLKENFKRSDFNKMQRLVFFQSLYMGYFQDDIRRFQEQCKLDIWELKELSRELDRTKKNYEAFVTEAHNDSVGLVKEQLGLEQIRQAATLELNKSRGAMTGLKSNIYKRDYKLSNVLLCRDLLLKLSPQTFRAAYRALVATNKKRELLKEEVIKLYTDYCRYNPEEGKDFFLDQAIHHLLENINTLGPPRIYFKKYWEIDMVLRRMELDCVDCFSDLIKIDDMQMEIVKVSRQVAKYFRSEKRRILSEISTGEAIFQEEKLRSNKLTENANNEINTFYKEVTIGDSVLETMGLVEVLHQDIFGPSKQKFGVMEMMNQIEGMLHRMETTIRLIPPNRYQHYERKVNKRLARERREPFNARRKYLETKSYIKRVNGMYGKPPMGYRWRRVLKRSPMPPFVHRKKQTTSARRASDVRIKHLQLNKICTRDDLEEDIDFIIRCHVRMRPKEVLEMEEMGDEESYMKHSSLRSSVDTESIEKIMGSEEGDDDIDTRSSFEILELGYDSDEMLIRENFKKRQEKGLAEEEPPNLYDVLTFDDRFLVKRVGAESTAEKDKRHSHRPENQANFNHLSWR
uniref:Bifunctional protein GlmU n=1 Tax=Lygus hesperus TaxID=30085 RepID=A0A0A9XZ56_LYGHE